MRIGIDLGGTKIEIVALGDDGRALLRQRVPTPTDGYEATLEVIVALVRDTEETLAQTGSVGIGIPGSPSPTNGRIRNANSTCLNGRPLREDLEALLLRRIRIANDANCLAVSEAADGAARGAESVFGVILGTGVGGGLVLTGRLIEGHNRIGGEWGHNPMPGEDPTTLPACYCGRRGCIETYLSGPGMAADHLRVTGQHLSAADIAAHAAAGDPDCGATLDRYEQRLARALGVVINIFDPECIVLGGGVSNIDRLYRSVPELLPAHVFSDVIATRIVRSRHGDSSGVRGAAWLWPAGADSEFLQKP